MQFEQFLFKLTKKAFSFGPFPSPDSLPLSGTPDKVTDKDEVKTPSNKYTQLPKKVVKLLPSDLVLSTVQCHFASKISDSFI